MTTKTKKKNTRIEIDSVASDQLAGQQCLSNAIYAFVATELIDFSPLNYRKQFSESALQAFAEELKQHGIISSLVVRKTVEGRYELVAGERRLRAARLADLKQIPVAIVSLSDEQVIEIQLAENLQRETPHPLHEAQAIGQMQAMQLAIDEIAARLGRSKQFIYGRLKLLQLIEEFKEMVFAQVLSLKEAQEIATLSPDAQRELFDARAVNWKKQKDFAFHSLNYYINQLRYSLKDAPFNTKDKNLLSHAGACSQCPHNSATLKSLFPEQAKQALCSNKTCYNEKCKAHFSIELTAQLLIYQPTALLCFSELPEYAVAMRDQTPEIAALPVHDYYNVARMDKPEMPEEQDYTYDNDEGEPELDADEWEGVMREYNTELTEYETSIATGLFQLGLLVAADRIEPIYFSLERPKTGRSSAVIVTAKQVQDALKTGAATPELLQAEINRLQQRHQRSLAIDQEKIQVDIHALFVERALKEIASTAPSEADSTAARWLLYHALTSNARDQLYTFLFNGQEEYDHIPFNILYHRLQQLTPAECTYLIRLAISEQSGSKDPKQAAGHCLYQAAIAAGLPIVPIEQAYAAKAQEREEKLTARITELQKKISKLQSSTADETPQ